MISDLHLARTAERGFSLVELSIVLVILGLLVGGILSGRTLIRASELRSVSADFQRYNTATMAFRDKYFGLPGDITNATRIWGAADLGDGVGSDCGDTESTDTKTCNGDGNSQIDWAPSNGVYERFRVFQHLANAGLIEGNFTGALTSGNAYVGRQLPASKLAQAGYEFCVTAIYTSTGHIFKLGRKIASTPDGLNGGALTPSEAWNIDQKMDDGLSDSGKILAIDATDASGCVTNGITYTPTTHGSYMLTSDTLSCRFYFTPGY